MPAQRPSILNACWRTINVLWAALGLWLLSALRNYREFDRWVQAVVPLLGGVLLVTAIGCLRRQAWACISLACLTVLAVLWSLDMLLFIAFRGVESRYWLLAVSLGLIFTALATWTLLVTLLVKHMHQKATAVNELERT
jgi:hypothetical protein